MSIENPNVKRESVADKNYEESLKRRQSAAQKEAAERDESYKKSLERRKTEPVKLDDGQEAMKAIERHEKKMQQAFKAVAKEIDKQKENK
jgi:hypothetical protein